jgi:hypothetical protein
MLYVSHTNESVVYIFRTILGSRILEIRWQEMQTKVTDLLEKVHLSFQEQWFFFWSKRLLNQVDSISNIRKWRGASSQQPPSVVV